MMKLMRRFRDLGIEGGMARWYDRNTKEHRLNEMRCYAKEVAGYIEDGDTVLEIAPGPGYLSIELARLNDYGITGVDISKNFVEIARKNAREAGVKVTFRQGNVSDLPIADETIDFVICTAAFKNFKEPLKALHEISRVLKPEGIALIVDMNRGVSNQEIDAFTNSIGVKGMEAIFMKSTFKFFLKKGAYTSDGFVELISKTPFKNYEIKKLGIALYVYLRKQKVAETVDAY